MESKNSTTKLTPKEEEIILRIVGLSEKYNVPVGEIWDYLYEIADDEDASKNN